MDRPTAYNLMSSFDQPEICQMNEILFRKNRYLGVVVPKRSPFLERTAVCVSWMRETGILKRIINLWE